MCCHLPARWKILRRGLSDELADHFSRRAAEGLHQCLQLPLCGLIDAELKPPVIIPRVMRSDGGFPRTPTGWQILWRHLTHRVPQPRGHSHVRGVTGWRSSGSTSICTT
jgi:hypothetical protein